jgi:hypothetical protein
MVNGRKTANFNYIAPHQTNGGQRKKNRRTTMQMLLSTTALLATILTGCGRDLASHTLDDTPKVLVGSTRDACQRDNVVTVFGQNIAALEFKDFDLPAYTTEFYWYCAGTRERSANDAPFNNIEIGRSDTGALQINFYVKR